MRSSISALCVSCCRTLCLFMTVPSSLSYQHTLLFGISVTRLLCMCVYVRLGSPCILEQYWRLQLQALQQMFFLLLMSNAQLVSVMMSSPWSKSHYSFTACLRISTHPQRATWRSFFGRCTICLQAMMPRWSNCLFWFSRRKNGSTDFFRSWLMAAMTANLLCNELFE